VRRRKRRGRKQHRPHRLPASIATPPAGTRAIAAATSPSSPLRGMPDPDGRLDSDDGEVLLFRHSGEGVQGTVPQLNVGPDGTQPECPFLT
jgi:hypothetical protein